MSFKELYKKVVRLGYYIFSSEDIAIFHPDIANARQIIPSLISKYRVID